MLVEVSSEVSSEVSGSSELSELSGFSGSVVPSTGVSVSSGVASAGWSELDSSVGDSVGMAETGVIGVRGVESPPKSKLAKRRKAILSLRVNFFIANPYPIQTQDFGITVIISHISKIVNRWGHNLRG